MKDTFMIINKDIIEIHGFENINDRISVRFFNNSVVVSPVHETHAEETQEYIVCLEEKQDIQSEEKFFVSDNELLVKELKNRGYIRVDFLYQKSSDTYFEI